MHLSPLEIGVVVLLIIVLFGTRRLPEVGAGLGHAITNFRKAFREGSEQTNSTPDDKDTKAS